MTELPHWVVQEVGRLHLHALALERENARMCDHGETTAGRPEQS